ncbi:MAG: hypothetical protein ABIO41_05490 [Ignavibacteria bacterium]
MDYLLMVYPNITEEYISKSNLALNVYSAKKINDDKIRKLISDFHLMMEKFLAQTERDSDYVAERIHLLNSLFKRDLLKRFESNAKELYKIQSTTFPKESIFYQNQINLEDVNFRYNINKYKKEFAECLQNSSDLIDSNFMFLKLHCFREMNLNELGKGKTFTKNFINEIKSRIEENVTEISNKHPNLYIIYLVTMMENTMDDNYLNILLKYLDKNGRKFKKDNLIFYYNYLRNYYVQKINNGEADYREKAFDLIKFMERNDLLLFENKISDVDYNNVISIVLPLKEFNWLESFIEKYKLRIDKEYFEDSYNLAKARIYYHRKKYNNIFEHLNNVKFKDPYYYMHSKFILGRVYYEMGKFESCKYIIQNLRQYVRMKNVLIPGLIFAIKNFNKYLSDLIKFAEDNTKDIKSETIILKKSLDNEKGIVPDKIWFYEKIKSLN